MKYSIAIDTLRAEMPAIDKLRELAVTGYEIAAKPVVKLMTPIGMGPAGVFGVGLAAGVVSLWYQMISRWM